jgi:hypothetical protein
MMKDLFVCQLYFSLKLNIEGSERHQTFVIVSDDTAREDNLWLQYDFWRHCYLLFLFKKISEKMDSRLIHRKGHRKCIITP